MGNRMENIQPGAMPWMNRYIGNPRAQRLPQPALPHAASATPTAACAPCAATCLPRLDLRLDGDGVRLGDGDPRRRRRDLDVREFPIELHPRGGESKLTPFSDGWRHLRLMLVYNPNFLFLLPGLLVALVGAAHDGARSSRSVSLFGHTFYVHTLIGGSLLRRRRHAAGRLRPLRPRLRRLPARRPRSRGSSAASAGSASSTGSLAGAGVTLVGLVLGGVVVGEWIASGLGSLAEERVTILAATLVIVGVQVFFTSFLLSILSLRPRESSTSPPHALIGAQS